MQITVSFKIFILEFLYKLSYIDFYRIMNENIAIFHIFLWFQNTILLSCCQIFCEFREIWKNTLYDINKIRVKKIRIKSNVCIFVYIPAVCIKMHRHQGKSFVKVIYCLSWYKAITNIFLFSICNWCPKCTRDCTFYVNYRFYHVLSIIENEKYTT